MKAEIVSVGTELLLGEITDTNASFLAAQLPPLGIELYWISQVGDNQNRMIEVLRRAWQRSDLILVTGGLGPTDDDLTREAIAEMLGEKTTIDQSLVHEIAAFFARLHFEMPPSNIKQAAVIPSAEPIHNEYGTAPGWWVEKEGRIIVAMPGPPKELQLLWHNKILPRIIQKCAGGIIFSRTFKTFGLSEAKAGELVAHLFPSSNPTLGIYAKPDGIHLRLAAKAPDRKRAEEIMAPAVAEIRSIFSEYIWGTDDDTMETAAGRMLTEKGLSLAAMECFTGGLLADTITNVPEASAYFKGGLVACSDETIVACGIDSRLISNHGAVSSEVAQAMAQAARLKLNADIGIGITGMNTEDKVEGKPVCEVFTAIADGKNKRVTRGSYHRERTWEKRRVVNTALVELLRMLGKSK